jgi:hypothetical protein
LANLLTLILVFGAVFALIRLDSLLALLALPFCVGPLAAYRTNPTLTAAAAGCVSSIYWTAVAAIPFLTVAAILALTVPELGRILAIRPVFLSITIVYFLIASWFGGRVGGNIPR